MPKVTLLEIRGDYDDEYGQSFCREKFLEWREVTDQELSALEQIVAENNKKSYYKSDVRLTLIRELSSMPTANLPKTFDDYLQEARDYYKNKKAKIEKQKEIQTKRQATREARKKEKELKILEQLKQKYEEK